MAEDPARTAAPTPAFVLAHLLACSTLWASSFLFIKLSGDLSPFVVAAVRGLIGAATLGLVFLVQGRRLLPQGREWRDWLVLGTFNGWAPNVLLAYALTQIGTAPAAMIQASSPLMVALGAHWSFADERLSARRLVGVLIGFLGIATLIGPAAFPQSGVPAGGALAMLATAVSYAISNLYVRTIRTADPGRLALGQQLCSGIPATILALAVAGPAAFAAVPERWAPVLALGVLATAVPVVLFMRLIRVAGPTRASMVGYLMPVWTAVLAVLFLNETIGLRELAGGAVVLVGVALVSFTGKTR